MLKKRKTKRQREDEEMLDRLQYGLSIQKRIHKGYEEYERATTKWGKDVHKKTGFKLNQMFGKYQYVLRSEKGEISIIKIKKLNFGIGKRKDAWGWEMYSNNQLFTDTRTFRTKKDAFEVAKQYLL